MRKIVINGGKKLKGEINVQGSKNSILPILAASILCEEECLIHNCPKIIDVEVTIEILKYLGCEVSFKNSTISVNAKKLNKNDIPEFLMRKMRSSIIFLGALISRTSNAKLSLPGGCELGPRPIDMHIQGLKQIGVNFSENHGEIKCFIDKLYKNKKIVLLFPSVGATQNLILSAVKSPGFTTIQNAAREPEIVDFSNFLIKMGAKIKGAGTGEIEIKGVEKLNGTEYFIIPDRIVASTYLCAAAITKSSILLKTNIENMIDSTISILEKSGCFIKKYDDHLQIISPEKLNSVNCIRTMPYPGFPTDAQAIFMSMFTISKGTSIFIETIFENRYKHVDELLRLGANIKVEGKIAIVEGVKEISGANVNSTDLRGAAALVVAGLACNGTTTISNIFHLERGYDNIIENLKILGADIKVI